MRNRMKGFYRVKSLNPARGSARSSFNSQPFFSATDESSMDGFANNVALGKELERLIVESDDSIENKDLLKKLASLKYRDVLRETLQEMTRKVSEASELAGKLCARVSSKWK